jgi:hypothetical protein
VPNAGYRGSNSPSAVHHGTKTAFGDHGESIDFEGAVAALGDRGLAERVRNASIAVHGDAEHARVRGIVLADTISRRSSTTRRWRAAANWPVGRDRVAPTTVADYIGRRTMHRLRSRSRVLSGVAALLAAAGLASLAAIGPAAGAVASTPSTSTVCQPHVTIGVLPVWARAGYSSPRARMAYSLGRAGKIAALLWANPLLSPPSRTYNNKILWVSHESAVPGSDLQISAQRMTGSRALGAPVSRRVMGGPGPSIINLPAAGCWRFRLRWSGRTDTIDLRYVASR